jgi:hypothetical protein
LKCNGQDISRKKSKGKGRIMVILPAQIALKHGTEGQIGILEKADTDKPEFVVETVEVCCHTSDRTFHFDVFPSVYDSP